MVYESLTTTKTLAHFYKVSPNTVRRTMKSTALVLITVQNLLMSTFTPLLRTMPPDYANAVMSWDETGERLTLDSLSSGTSESKQSVWQVMVLKFRLSWGWIDFNKSGPRSQWLDLILPPFALISTAAESLCAQLFHHPIMKPVHAFMQQLFSAAKISFSLREVDGAFSNDRLEAHLLQLGKTSSQLDASFYCRNHSHNLITIFHCGLVGLKLTCELFTLAVFLGTRESECGVRLRQITKLCLIFKTSPRMNSKTLNDFESFKWFL